MKNFLYAYSDAIDESFEKGTEQGRDDERTATALDMLADNVPIEKIAKYSHLPKEKYWNCRSLWRQKTLNNQI